MLLLELLRDDEVALVHRIEDRPAHLGRATANDLILNDPLVSEHHAVVWTRGGRAWVRDLGSSNGTSVNGQRLVEPHLLQEGDRIELGTTVLRVAARSDAPPKEARLVLEHVATGVCVHLLGSRVQAGSAPDSDLQLPDAPPRLFTLLVHPGPDLWLVTNDGEGELEPDVPFEVQGRAFVVRLATGDEPSTVVPDRRPAAPRIRLEARLDGPTGPVAVLTDLDHGRAHTVDAENRAVLLFLLARARQDDLDAGGAAEEAGWRADEELRRGVWGRSSRDNQLNVLLHRLRGELGEAGIDPWVLEKRRRYTRIRVAEASVPSAA